MEKSASDCVKINLRRSKTEKFLGGGGGGGAPRCPQTPLEGCGLKPTALTVTCAPPPLYFLDPPLAYFSEQNNSAYGTKEPITLDELLLK